MKIDGVSMKIGKQKRIALVAHDGKKPEMMAWAYENKEVLKGHFLCGTGTTARLLADKTGLPVKAFNSGPLGGDQQIGARIVEGSIDFLVFFSDPLEAQPHDPDVKALLRIAVVYNIPIANNVASADFMLKSVLMEQEYERQIDNVGKHLANRMEMVADEAIVADAVEDEPVKEELVKDEAIEEVIKEEVLEDTVEEGQEETLEKSDEETKYDF